MFNILALSLSFFLCYYIIATGEIKAGTRNNIGSVIATKGNAMI